MLERINRSNLKFIQFKKFSIYVWFLQKSRGLWSFFTYVHQFSIKNHGTVNQVGTSDISRWQMTDVFDTSESSKWKFKFNKKIIKCTYGKTNDPSINPVRHKTPFRRIFHSNSDFVRGFWNWVFQFGLVDSRFYSKKM